jgi:hypothetical protein
MKIQNLYETLEQEIKERKDNLTAKSWRGDLTKRGLQSIQWGDLKCIQDQVVNKQKCKINQGD